MRGTYVTALVIGLVLAAWLYSGWVNTDSATMHDSIAEQNRTAALVETESAPTRVRASVVQASEQFRLVTVRGKTENKRTVDVRVELDGRIVSRPVERGDAVKAGALLCKLSVEDRQVALTEAQAALQQARIDYQGALRLKEKGFNSDSAIAAAKSRLAGAIANVSRRELDLAKINVTAPFDGLVEDVHLEVGDFVSPGQQCATVIDPDPMLLTGRVSEQHVSAVRVGQIATGRLRDGRVVKGPISFVGQQNDPATRTYPLEIELPNADHSLRSGVTTEIQIPVESVLAQRISPALFSLDDAGAIGVRTVNADNVVEFYYVDILADAGDGVWVTGLPPRTAVITVGQELVVAGERVDPVFEGTTTLPAQSPASEQASDPAKPAGANATATETLALGAAGA